MREGLVEEQIATTQWGLRLKALTLVSQEDQIPRIRQNLEMGTVHQIPATPSQEELNIIVQQTLQTAIEPQLHCLEVPRRLGAIQD